MIRPERSETSAQERRHFGGGHVEAVAADLGPGGHELDQQRALRLMLQHPSPRAAASAVSVAHMTPVGRSSSRTEAAAGRQRRGSDQAQAACVHAAGRALGEDRGAGQLRSGVAVCDVGGGHLPPRRREWRLP
jgi:hypothetical protein